MDLSDFLETVLRLIEAQKSVKKQPKVTALKMADLISMREHEPLLKPLLSEAVEARRPLIERMLLFLVLQSYLREDFHFTPYNTISYLAPGSRSLPGGALPFPMLRRRRVPRPGPASPTVTVVNRARSKLVTKKQLLDYDPPREEEEEGEKEEEEPAPKLRRTVSAREGPSLDFGEDLECVKVETTKLAPLIVSSDSE